MIIAILLVVLVIILATPRKLVVEKNNMRFDVDGNVKDPVYSEFQYGYNYIIRTGAITERLIKLVSLLKLSIKVFVIDNSLINAAMDGINYENPIIVVDAGLLEKGSDEVVLGALAHEYGHYLNGDHIKDTTSMYRSDRAAAREMENNADMTAIKILQEAGLDPRCLIKTFEFWAIRNREDPYRPIAIEDEKGKHFSNYRRIQNVLTAIKK